MDKKINILFSSYPDFSGNPKALYEYINTNYISKFNMYWVAYSDTNVEHLKKNNIDVVFFQSEEYKDLMPNINIIFDTNGFLLSEKNPNQIYVNLWHGSSPKKKGYLLSVDNFAEQDIEYYKTARRKTDYLIVPSEFSKLIFASAFNVNAQNILPLGYPRDEYLLNCDGKENLQKLTNLNLKNYNKIIFYLPTFRKGANRVDAPDIFENNLLNINKYSEEDLVKFLEDNNYLLVVKKHPAEMNNINTNINTSNILILSEDSMTEKNLTIYELLNSADLLIADYSSVYVEYLLLEKPVLFFHQDINTYTQNRDLILQDAEIWFPGPRVYDFENFKKEIVQLLNNPNYYKIERLKFRNLMFTKDASNSSKNIFEYFFDKNNFTLKCHPKLHIEEEMDLKIKEQENAIQKLEIQNLKYETDIERITAEKNKFLDESVELNNKLNYIYNSKSWKLIQFMHKLKNGGKKS